MLADSLASNFAGGYAQNHNYRQQAIAQRSAICSPETPVSFETYVHECRKVVQLEATDANAASCQNRAGKWWDRQPPCCSCSIMWFRATKFMPQKIMLLRVFASCPNDLS